jgi:hypothetical protein
MSLFLSLVTYKPIGNFFSLKFPRGRVDLRALQLQKRQGVQLAEPDGDSGGRLRLQRHLQFHYSPESALQAEDVAQPHHPAARAPTGGRFFGRDFLLPACLLDAGLH